MRFNSPVAGRRRIAAGLLRSVPALSALLLSACAMGAGDPANGAVQNRAYGAYLAAHYAGAQHDPAAASRYYALALRADPGNPALSAAGFMAALQAGDDRAARLAPDVAGNSLAELLHGNQAVLDADYGQAAQIFAAVPGGDLTALITPILLAWTQAGQGDAAAGIMRLQARAGDAQAGAFSGVYVLNAALIADAAHDDTAAAGFYAQLSGDAPDLRLAQILASWDARQGKNDAADAVLAALAAAHPDLQLALPGLQAQIAQPVISTPAQGIAEAYLTIAGALQQPVQVALRIDFLRLALNVRPDLAAARLLLASALAGDGDPKAAPGPRALQDALASLAPIAQTDPLYAPACLQRANLLAALGRNDAAVAILNGLITADPGDPALPQNAGDILRNAGRFAAAIPFYTQALQDAGPAPPPAAWAVYFDRGISEDQLGDWHSAEPDLLAARALAPEQPYVLNYLAYDWAVRGEHLAEARAMLTKAVGLDPNDGAVVDSLGFLDLTRHRTGPALMLLTEATELDPDDAAVNAHLGDAFWQDGQKLQADYQWRRALSLHPDARLQAELIAKLAVFSSPGA